MLEKEHMAEESNLPGVMGAEGGTQEEKLTETFTVKLGLKTSREPSLSKGGEDFKEEFREIPLSMQRPRSNSGSRLLTDEVCFHC